MSIIYFYLMLFKGMFNYSLAVTFDSASFLKHLVPTDSCQTIFGELLVIWVLVALASQGEKLILNFNSYGFW